MTTRRLEIIILTTALLIWNAHAQQVQPQDDALVVARQVYRVAIENPYVLVVKVDVPPHYRSPMHTHQDLAAVIVALGDADYILNGDDGVAHQARQTQGKVAYREAGRPGLATRHQVENRGETPVRAIRVEFKDFPPFHELQPLRNDSRYTVEIDNPRIRVLRVRLGPGERLPRLNLGPNVRLDLTDSGTQHVGDSSWVEAGQQEINNPGDGPSEIIVVELKGRQ